MAISEQIRAELLSLDVPKQRVKVVHGAVIFPTFANADGSEIRSELGLDSSHILISTVGRAIPRKGWDIAIRAFAKVHSLIPMARFVFVGNTTSPVEAEFFKKLSMLIKECNVSQ